MNYAKVAEELRAIAENLDADNAEVHDLRALLAHERATNARLRLRVDQLLAQEDLHTVEGLRKELKRLNGLLNDMHADRIASALHPKPTREAIWRAALPVVVPTWSKLLWSKLSYPNGKGR